MFIRQCPECGNDVEHKTASGCRNAIQFGRSCRACGLKATRRTTQSPKWRAEQAARLVALWDDKDSRFNQPEYREALSEGQRERKRQETPEDTKARHDALVNGWANDTDRREAASLNGSNPVLVEARRQGNIAAWANDPERHIKASHDAAARMKDPEYKERCVRKMIEAAIRTGGKSKAETAIVTALEPYGFVGHKRVGQYYVDALNEGTRTIVEYYGDWWHVHPRVHNRINTDYGGVHPQVQLTIQQIQDYDQLRLSALQDAGYKVIVLWECDIRRGKRIDVNRIVDMVTKEQGHPS